jgi:hypothetical protein
MMYGFSPPPPATAPSTTQYVPGTTTQSNVPSLMPQIVSAGPDGQFGITSYPDLNDMTSGVLSAQAQDNITSANLVGLGNY